ncbi:MAG TPA: CRISPR-associated endonuclease Cas2 [Saprospiraceae bacterium]|nr:CRISPR-associated endonuclease Cas2 [Saprospiraceae bacterium]
MGRPKKANITPEERLQRLKQAGIDEPTSEDPMQPTSLPRGIQDLIITVKHKALKFNEMLYLVMYDIENNKVRTEVAKYLIAKGCVRIQKSVYLSRSNKKLYAEISSALEDIQSYYNNEDSIITMPLTHNALQAIKVIGKDIKIDNIVEPANTVFI